MVTFRNSKRNSA
uniref:Uncharacterized protein n=1 Tax=Anguilla anguilla TaxID=7936 RepID=A0A0E9PRS2_ANGAN